MSWLHWAIGIAFAVLAIIVLACAVGASEDMYD